MAAGTNCGDIPNLPALEEITASFLPRDESGAVKISIRWGGALIATSGASDRTKPGSRASCVTVDNLST